MCMNGSKNKYQHHNDALRTVHNVEQVMEYSLVWGEQCKVLENLQNML